MQSVARGPIPLDDALTIARQVAEAVEAAHEGGVVHRDLKPANIKVRPDGAVKVLDFGLAKALDSRSGGRDDGAAQPTNSPTITSPAALTSAGVILGTAAYMSPEQAKGRPADTRSDVWAFGCVLYEMLTAKRAFHAEDVSETLAAVLRGQPDWSALPTSTPPPICTLLTRALQKDRAKRLPAMSVARFLLSEDGLDTSAGAEASASRVRRPMSALVAAALVIGAAGALSAVWLATRQTPSSAAVVTRFRIALPPGTSLLKPNSYPDLALSPDGRRLAYIGLDASGRQQLYAQSLDQLAPTPVAGFDAGQRPFFSPDGQWIGLCVGDRVLVKIPSSGGASVKVCDVTGGGIGTWLPDDSIVFSQREPGLWRVPASGGTPTALTTPDGTTELAHRSPEALPGGRAIVYAIVRRRPTTSTAATWSSLAPGSFSRSRSTSSG